MIRDLRDIRQIIVSLVMILFFYLLTVGFIKAL